MVNYPQPSPPNFHSNMSFLPRFRASRGPVVATGPSMPLTLCLDFRVHMHTLSRAKLAMSQNPRNPGIMMQSPCNQVPRQSYSQVVQTRKPTRDPEKQARDPGKMSCD